MIMQLTARSGESEVTIPAWLWGGTGAVLLLLVGGLGTWVGATIFDHEKRISVTEEKIGGIDKTIMRVESTVDKVDAKIDRVLERLQN